MAIEKKLVCGFALFALVALECERRPVMAQMVEGELWSFVGESGDVVRVVASSDAFDVAIELLAPDMDIVGLDDDGGIGTDSSLVAVLYDTGRHFVRVGSYGERAGGPYEVTVRELSVGELPHVAMREGMLDPSSNEGVGLWALEGGAGQIVSVSAHSPDFDTTVELLSPTGELVAFNDDGPRGTDSELVVALPVSGRYLVQIASYDERAGGRYGVVWREMGRPPLEFRGVLLPNESDGGYFDFVGAADEIVRVAVGSPDFDTTIELVAPDGQVLGFDDDSGDGLNSEVLVVLPSIGRYRVQVSSYGARGAYEAVVTPVEAPLLMIGVAVPGTLGTDGGRAR